MDDERGRRKDQGERQMGGAEVSRLGWPRSGRVSSLVLRIVSRIWGRVSPGSFVVRSAEQKKGARVCRVEPWATGIRGVGG